MAVDSDGACCRLTLPGGELDRPTASALVEAAVALREDRAVRVVVINSASAPFCTGPAADLDPITIDPDPAAALAALRVPVIAVIDGACHSVGLEIALAADIRIATPRASFALPDLGADRLPCWGGTQRLARAVRPSEATAMVMLGTTVDAERALSLGLVHLVSEDVDTATAAAVDDVVARGPLALEFAKEAVHRGAELPLRDGLRLEGDLNHQLAATDDRAEGLQAFFDKRPPDFAGR